MTQPVATADETRSLPCGCAITIRHAHFEGNFLCLQPVTGIPVKAWIVAGGREGVEPSDWFLEYASLEAADEAFDGFELELLAWLLDEPSEVVL